MEQTLCRRLPDPDAAAPAATATPAEVGNLPAPAPVDDREGWLAARARLLGAQARPRFVSATAIARQVAAQGDGAAAGPAAGPEPAADVTDVAEPEVEAPWRRGRAGTAIGRAVHATLQLHRGGDDELDALAHQHAHLEAVPEAATTIAALARSALRAPTVRAALAAPRSWRELYVAAPVGDRAVEGYIDLLYEGPEGLVLVDYKTDAVAGPADADARAARYGVQTAAYAVALEASTGLSVVAAHLVFCTTGEPIERAVPDLPAAKAAVVELLRATPA
jgi:ATP-dependent helicase/nuclease subunit A